MSGKIDVVIPTRDREHLLLHVVTSLLRDPAVDRIVIVDDADRGGVEAGELAAAALSERVEVVATGGAGPARARQAGAERAQAELLLFLDDDVLPEDGLATRHVARHAAGEALVVCGYTPVIPRPGTRLSGEAEVYGRIYEDRCAQYEAQPQAILTHLWGGNFSLRRADALRIGLASEHFTELSHEDRDFGLRCLEAGMSAVFDRTLCAGHQYERAWPRAGLDSYRRGYSIVLLHELHRGAIGPFDERQFERNLPRPVALLVHAAGRYRAGRIVSGGLHALRLTGARLHLRRLELGSVRLLRRIKAARGAHAALASGAVRRWAADG